MQLIWNWKKLLKVHCQELKIEHIADIINRFAIFSAIAASVTLFPGIGGLISVVAQTGLVWGTYVTINKALGISMKENVAKFIGSAVLTNISINAASILLAYLGSTILSLLSVGNLFATVMNAALGYIIIYVSAIIYLKVLTDVMKAKGTFDMDESDKTKGIIEKVVKESNLKEMINEGNEVFKEAQKNGEFDKAKCNPQCPFCGENVKQGQKFCSKCGNKLN